VRLEDGLDPAEAASHIEWREAAREFDIHIKNGVEALAARMNPKAAGAFEGQLFSLEERFGADFGWSASKLESYGTCPFEFFVAYGLGLEPREEPEEGYDVRALGTMLHEILEKYLAGEGGADLRETAQAVFAEAPAKHGFRPTPLWELQKAELLRRLEETVAALAEASQGWRPFKQELKFGMGEPSLVLETEAGPVRLHGYIDRVDIAEDGGLRVIDYKTGGAAITAAHLREGRRLQLPIYALAAQKALGLGTVTHGFYWHIQKAEPSSLKLEKFEDGINSAFAVAIAHVGRHVSGIRAGHFEPKPPAEGCPSYCPAVNFCWRYKKGF
jgi:ATP-dependent helicase/DNAse subunit B